MVDWRLYFDGAVNRKGVGIRIVMTTLIGEVILVAKKLNFWVTNNIAEYEACALGLKTLLTMGIREVIVSQVTSN